MLTREMVAQAYIQEFKSHVGQKEAGGNNRSAVIDRFNRMAGVPMGTPWCCSSATGVLIDTCKKRGWKVPADFRCDAGTQHFFERSSKLHPKYISKTPIVGAIGIYQKRRDPSHGHAFAVAGPARLGVMATVEGNTDSAGGRDGDGFWAKNRFTAGNASMRIRGYVDVCQWVADANR
jgi:hypothetical protein